MKRKGFTLIELLAVIIILAVIALIATPVVLNVVDSAKKSSFESTAYGIVDTIRLDYQEGILDESHGAKTYDFSTTTDIDNKFSGEKPQGIAKVDEDGRIEIAIHNGKWCALKKLNEGTITIIDYDAETCVLEERTTDGDTAKKLLKIEVAENVYYNFYVLKDNGDTITAIMDRNYSEKVAWGKSGDNIPTVANTALPTSTEWSNATEVRLPNAKELLEQTEWYKSGLTEEQQNNWDTGWENEYFTHMNTIYADETLSASVNACYSVENINACIRNEMLNANRGDILLPKWLDINLKSTGADSTNGYWTNDLVSLYPDNVWGASYRGDMIFSPVDNSDNAGVRPVITINKSHIKKEFTEPQYVEEGFIRE